MFQRVIGTIAGALCLLSAPAIAQPEPVPVEVWADTNQVQSLDMAPDAERIAMLMRRDRAADPELIIFDTDDIQGSIQAIQTEGLIPQSVFWANDTHIVVELILETEDGGRPVYLPRTASYNVKTKKWQSLVRTTNRPNPRDPMQEFMGSLGIGEVVASLPDEKNKVLVSHTEDPGESPNYYITDVRNGNRDRVLRSGERFSSFTFDRAGQPRGAEEYDAARNRIVTYARISPDDDWKEIGALNADSRDVFSLVGFFNPGRPELATVVANEPGRDATAIYDVDIRTGEREMLFGTERYDAVGVIRSPRLSDGAKIVGYWYSDLEGTKPYYIDEYFGSLHASIEAAFPGKDVSIRRVSDDNSTTLIYVTSPQDPGSWYLIKDNKVAPVITRNPEIPEEALSPQELVTYTARDGMEISGYVTIPRDMEGPFPTIAMPHGGPWVRDEKGYDEWAQMLANKGYAVFQPNYRGSRGLGKKHWIAGDNQWGLSMQDDVEDGISKLVEMGVADPDKLGFFGWSYGGYSAFAAATRDNDMFNCIAAGAGVSDISRIRGGLAGSRFLREFQKPTISGVNPIEHTDKVTVPMLLIHGDYDTTVPVEHSRRWVSRLEDMGADVKYVEIEDMTHSPFWYEQNMQWLPELFEFFDTKCGF
ncbi:alpha/beta hydrolase family protein [Henriciella mobilis]|uniref:S9 family peptidase n=1 Tax=Henriciella mobilis TaxID=2305467 RepID=A0A399RF12_9PROT|nr:prolyl oligopeptidase family serine peptidase [Henriciella mobilis]RIJ28455.1 S9 family peptidase [Henriciella mobilis]